MLLRRAKSLAQSLDRASGRGDGDPNHKRPSSTHFSLQTSALSRTVSRRIGRGASCGLLQEVAAAAVSEAGEKNVSASDLSANRNSCFMQFTEWVCWSVAHICFRHAVGGDFGSFWPTPSTHRR